MISVSTELGFIGRPVSVYAPNVFRQAIACQLTDHAARHDENYKRLFASPLMVRDVLRACLRSIVSWTCSTRGWIRWMPLGVRSGYASK